MRTLIAALAASLTLGLGGASADVIYDWVPTSPAVVPGFGDVPFYGSITLTDEAVERGGVTVGYDGQFFDLPRGPFDPLAVEPVTVASATGGVSDFSFSFGPEPGAFSVTANDFQEVLDFYVATGGLASGFRNQVYRFDFDVTGEALVGRFVANNQRTDFAGAFDAIWTVNYNSDRGFPCTVTGRCQDATGRFVRRDAPTAVAEPATLALLMPGPGLLGLAGYRRR